MHATSLATLALLLTASPILARPRYYGKRQEVQRVSKDPNAPIQYVLGQPTLTVATYDGGENPPVSGAPVLPAPFVFDASKWPEADKIPPIDSPEVKAWMKELDGITLPSFGPTVDGTCGSDPAAASEAESRGWWSCGGFTRDSDIVSCPDKGTWGVSFDDGPADYTPTLLRFLNEKNIKATFFNVGSRVVQNSDTLREEYMTGHEVSVHSWSHAKALTSMTNEEIVAELGWTRKAIKDVLGVTPTTMRPPLGDIDDRVRAISMAMGLVPIMWTPSPSGATFDTNDWKVPANLTTIDESFKVFDKILDEASDLDTGFIVLQHDQHEVTVSMAIDHTLNTALNRNPPFKLQKISECQKLEAGEFYRETSKTFAPKKDPLSNVNAASNDTSTSTAPTSATTSASTASSSVSASTQASSSASQSSSTNQASSVSSAPAVSSNTVSASEANATNAPSDGNAPSGQEKAGQGQSEANKIQAAATDNGALNAKASIGTSVGMLLMTLVLGGLV